ncbi:unnamed protein product, partial [Rotaria sp. Silwood2]
MTLTAVDTPGLFDRRSYTHDMQLVDNEIDNIKNMCIRQGVTEFHLICFCASLEAGINNQDLQAIEKFLDYFGLELAQHLCMVITRCESKNEQQRELIRAEIERDTYFQSITRRLNKGIYFSGALKCDDWNRANDAILLQFYNICEYRNKLIELLENSRTTFKMKPLISEHKSSTSHSRPLVPTADDQQLTPQHSHCPYILMNCSHRQHQYKSNDIMYQKDSLLKYESPRLIVSHDISETDVKKICRATISPCFQPTSLYDTNLKLFDPYSDLCRPADILDFLFPPIEHIDKNNHKYIICVSRHPATKIDVYNLEKNLDHRLKLSQALEVGLCNHRRKIYNECFDELVRQITIECSERGILLSRIRNTYRQMMNDYLNNYLSANAYAMRTLLLNEEIKIKLNNQIDHLEYDIEQIKKQLINAEDHF